MLGVVAALFGLLFAFIIVIAYQNYTDAQGKVTGEADALAAVVRDSGARRERVVETRFLMAAGGRFQTFGA